jgi:1-phosphofructokinase
VVAGSLPRGVTAQWLRELIERLNQLGLKVALDSSGEALREALKASPWLIKPNTEELADALGCEVVSHTAEAQAAARLHAQGIEHVVISHGADGVNWFSVGSALHAAPPKVSVASTVGAGDSLLAGMLHGLLSADTPEQTLRTATAIAAMAVTQIGFGIHDRAQLAQLEQGVRVRPLTEQ